jgi:hypothetical protein
MGTPGRGTNMKQYKKYIDKQGRETTKDKAVGQVVSIYDDDGKFLEEQHGLVDREDQAAVS